MAKPPGLPSELPRDPRADSLITRLRSEGFDELRLVHRLDSPTSGVMIVARTAAAAAHYSAEIAARRWRKLYVAQIGWPVDRAARLIGDHKAYLATEGRRAAVVRSGGKPSFLTIVHAAPSPLGAHLLIRLHTGRFHQIRAMLAHLGAALTGDTPYGGSADAPFYLEHVLLGARLFGAEAFSAWRAPAGDGRPRWSASLSDAVAAEEAQVHQA